MNKYLLLILFSPFLFLLYYILIYFRTGVPIVITPKEYYIELFKFLEIKKDTVVYELGCGQGDFLFAAERFEPKKLVGFELSFLHVLYGRLKARIKYSEVKFLYQDFFSANLADADLIYLFLVSPIVIKAWAKIKKEARPGTIVVVLADIIPNENYFQKIPTKPDNPKSSFYYLYRI